jgi:MFS family permease
VTDIHSRACVVTPSTAGLTSTSKKIALSWRAVFLVNVPPGIAVLALTPLPRADRAEHRPRLDVTGTALAVVGMGLVVYPLIEGVRLWWLVGGLMVLVVFGLHQRHRASPLVELSLFRNRGFPAALVTSLLFFAVMNGLMLVVVLQVQLTRHADVLTAGLTLVPWSCGMALASWVGGAYLVPRFGSRLMFGGLGVLLAGIVVWPVVPVVALAISGLGIGTFTVPFFTTALHRVRPAETGSAAGLLNAVQQLGGTMGVALLGTVFFHAGDARPAFWVAAGLLVATGVAAALMTDDGGHDHRGGTAGRP